MMILTEGRLGTYESKTANCLVRYCPKEVVCILDSQAAGKNLSDFLGIGKDIPIVATVAEGLHYRPTELVLGVAPVGGRPEPAWRKLILAALEARLDVVSGMHQLLTSDRELRETARRHNAHLWDVRRTPSDLDVAADRLRDLKQKRVLVVGADCNLGKMVAALEIAIGLKLAGWCAEFVATGQTGIMIAGGGIAVDHVLSDFVNGAVERLCWERKNQEILVIEGQGSLTHPGFSAVSAGLLHGSLPHAMVFVHDPRRKTYRHYDHLKLPPLKEMIRLNETMVAPLHPAKVVAVALNTWGMLPAAAKAAVKKCEDETGLPACDVVRDGPGKIVEALEFLRGKKTAKARDGKMAKVKKKDGRKFKK
jgi:uncharacterized NAD-dependent epimerase/dehydratase family protein